MDKIHCTKNNIHVIKHCIYIGYNYWEYYQTLFYIRFFNFNYFENYSIWTLINLQIIWFIIYLKWNLIDLKFNGSEN